jgi:hypothetical protein
MKITIDGKEFNAIPVEESLDYYLEPVKKTESKDTYTVMMVHQDFEHDFSKDLSLTPPTANKLSEAISALVEYMESPDSGNDKLIDLAAKASVAYQESQ